MRTIKITGVRIESEDIEVTEVKTEFEMGPQFQILVETLSQVFFPISLVVTIVSLYYETLCFHSFWMSGLTLSEIRQKKENPKEVLEQVIIDKKEDAIKN